MCGTERQPAHDIILEGIVSFIELFILIFSVRRVSILRGHLGFSFPPQRPMTFDFPDVIHYILHLNSGERTFENLERLIH